MKIETVDGQEYWIVTHPDDLLSWKIIHIEDFKPGVKRLHTRNAALPSEFRLLYCSTEILTERANLRAGTLHTDIVIEDILDAHVVG